MTGAGPGPGPREQRLVFGEDAALYDRARPGYPAELVDDVLGYLGGAGDPQPRWRALEVGAGTGKATAAFAVRAVAVVALEPDPAMAAVAVRNCAPHAGVRVVESTFEAWPVEPGAFDLVFSGQAWHWVRPEDRVRRAAAHLRPGGAVALFWHRTAWAPGDPLRAALDECYRTHAPHLYAKGPGFPGLTPPALQRRAGDELAGSASFEDVVVRTHPWDATFGAAGFVDLLRTQSDHRLLDDGARRRLLGAVREIVAERGDEVRVPFDVLLVLGRRVG